MTAKPRPVHLERTDYPGATYCGQGGVTFSGKTTTDPDAATCKSCLRVWRPIRADRDARAHLWEGLDR